jgi:Spy/CpxP family protein refolding chaperone
LIVQLSRRLLINGAASLIVALVASVAASGAMAGPGHFRGPGGFGGGPMLLSPELLHTADLTADQKTKLEAIRQSYRDARQSIFSQLRTAEDGLRARYLAPGALSEADLASGVATVTQLRQQLMQQDVKEALDVRSVLTADQLAKMASTQQQLETLHSQMRAVLHGSGSDDAS